jgi:peptidoglycan/LPS O-acetylase OafA/YrhL
LSEPKKRPGPLWLFFYGRQRRGFPWLLVVVAVVIILLALSFAIPGAADTWRAVAPFIFGVVVVAAIGLLVAAMFRSPRRRR